MEYFEIHARMHCPWCLKAVELLKKKGLPFIVVNYDNLGEDMSPLRAAKYKYEWDTVPLVLENIVFVPEKTEGAKFETYKRLIGGFAELEEYLNQEKEEEDV